MSEKKACRAIGVDITGVSQAEKDDAHKLLEQWMDLSQKLAGPEGVAKINREVRYMSCIFWVLSASKAKEAKTDGGAGGSARTTPTMHSLLQSTNTPVFDFFLQTSQLGKLAEKLPLFQELLPAGGTAARLLKAFTTLEVQFIILVMVCAKLKKIVEDLVREEVRRVHIHRTTWLLFLNVQQVYGAFDMFPAFCLCVASLHAVLASAAGISPQSLVETGDERVTEATAAEATAKALRSQWSDNMLTKACTEKSVIVEVRRAASKVATQVMSLSLFVSVSSNQIGRVQSSSCVCVCVCARAYDMRCVSMFTRVCVCVYVGYMCVGVCMMMLCVFGCGYV